MSGLSFKEEILQGIPEVLPELKPYDLKINHAPKRKDILTHKEKELALHNALRYFKEKHHAILAPEFAKELETYGRIYMYRFKPEYEIYARPINDYPHKSIQAAAIMHMYFNNLDPKVAQHPDELIIYGGNGAAFQNWAQFRLTMQYLATMTDEQTLVMNSGLPLGLFPSHKDAPRVVISNGMVIPNHSSLDDYERMNVLGVSQYGQMTAGSAMYIGPQGIVHGTTITLLNASRKIDKDANDLKGKVFVSSGLGGMSGAQAKASVIAGGIGVIAEINPKAIEKRHEQKWLDEIHSDLTKLLERINLAKEKKESVSLGYLGNIVDLWEFLAKENINIDIGSDQTSLHNPFAGGYYPVGLSFEDSKKMMTENPEKFKELVQKSLIRQVIAINKLTSRGMYFFDYGNAFLLQTSKAGADIMNDDKTKFRYPSYVEDIMGPICFDYGFGPFRWVCTSADKKDLEVTDKLAADVLEEQAKNASKEIKQQILDNLKWIIEAQKNNLVVGSQARILYSNCEGRTKIAKAFNDAVNSRKISGPVVIGRDHHDVSGTDSPYRETSNIYDGSSFTADMAIQNVIGDSFRGATWVSIHNGGGVGWGEVINGGFGMVLDGSQDSDRRLNSMIHFDVNNGLARRSWAGNSGAQYSIKNAMQNEPKLKITVPYNAHKELIKKALTKN
ncbi:MAG: urocanate hydratase [Candidatus Diapherotrites archaeon CG08_land_8_20_14_0_20_30_16]|nr:MAG: urocanate hydratase [Candidatus Diapherotrites archaeon CG08_land_8_20_14_0_20_30_16]